jgi:hypothetical protein
MIDMANNQITKVHKTALVLNIIDQDLKVLKEFVASTTTSNILYLREGAQEDFFLVKHISKGCDSRVNVS